MKAKLQPRFKRRIPLVCLLKGNTIWFRSQIEVTRADGLCAGTHLEFNQISADKPLYEIGKFVIMLLERFQTIGDLTLDEVKDLTGFEFKSDEYNDNRASKEFIKNDKDRMLYTETFIDYTLETNKYSFIYCWYEKYKNSYAWTSSEDSYGKSDVLTFKTPLEFIKYPEPEELGRMLMEAFDRSRMMGNIVLNGHLPKAITLLNGAEILMEEPNDKHFADYGDYGVGELHQAYLYFAKEGADSSAEFYLGIAAELDCDMSEENIRRAWEKQNGKAEFFEVKSVEHGIFKFRAEMRNKSVHRISYLLEIADCDLLDCTMELYKPNSRKKLDEKLSSLFEEFARQCKFKN